MKNKPIKASGPIATRLIRDVLRFKKQKVVDLAAIRSAKAYMDTMANKHDLSHLDPLHATYMNVQHRIADFFDQISMGDYGDKFNTCHEHANEIYMPSGPPMSPVTNSFYTCWLAFDMKIGVKKETITSIMIDLYHSLDANEELLKVLEMMQSSYPGLYVFENSDNDFVYLRELYMNQTHKVLVPDGYEGMPGEIWLVRLFPSLYPELADYSLAFTTPYVIMDIPLSGSHVKPYHESEWLDFIERSLLRVKAKTSQEAYYHFMKYGLDKHYWLEYIFLAYINAQNNMILLTGFPDQPKSLPHHPENAAKLEALFTQGMSE